MRKHQKQIMAMLLASSLIFTGCSAKKNTTSDVKPSQTKTASVDIKASEIISIKGEYSDTAKEGAWNEEDSINIKLTNTSAEVSSESVTVETSNNKSTKVNILKGGTYVVSGTLDNGTIFVNAPKEENVQIVLNGASITSKDYAAIVGVQAKNVFVTLAKDTTNTIVDAKDYQYASDDTIKPTAAIFSKTDLIINGTGTLNLTANYKDGITTKDDLELISGNISITANDDGIVGKDSISVLDGKITINAKGDGLKTTNQDEADKGFIVIDGGVFDITAVNDGFQAENQLIINDGNFQIVTNEGSENASKKKGKEEPPQRPDGENGERPEQPQGGENGERPEPPQGGENGERPEPPQGGENGERPEPPQGGENGERPEPPQGGENGERPEQPQGGEKKDSEQSQEEQLPSAKALKATNGIGIFGGNFTMDSADDAVHSNGAVRVADGTLELSTGDDGIHGGSDLSIEGGNVTVKKCYEGLESNNVSISGGKIDITASDDGVNVNGSDSEKTKLTITGGELSVNAQGDGLDSNGSITMSGGVVSVDGPVSNGDGALDYDGTFDFTGGELYVSGSSGMAQVPSESSTQPFIANVFENSISAGTEVVVTNAEGEAVARWTPSKEFSLICVANGSICLDKTYTVTAGTEKVEVKAGTTSTIKSGGPGGPDGKMPRK